MKIYITICGISYLLIFLLARTTADNQINGVCGDPKYNWRCDSGECILLLRKCDGEKNCIDNSDEKNCRSFYCNKDTHFVCSDDKCIDQRMVCDGSEDCSNDEADCFKECKNDEIPCDRGHCIKTEYRCDGYQDCEDGTDESECKKHVCPVGYLPCHDNSSSCVLIQHFCDGSANCPNEIDENQCEKNLSRCFPETGLFPCHDNSKCIKKELVCDNIPHCNDHSDEKGECGVKCSEHQCEHACYETPNGPQCLCNKGYRFKDNTKKCQDIDECMEDVQVCDHFCQNRIGNFECTCAPHYTLLSDDNASCRRNGGPALLLFSVGNSIKARYIKGKESWIVHSGEHKITGIAYDPVDEDVYWVSDNSKILFKNLHKNNNVKTFIYEGLNQPEGIIIDLVARNLYIADLQQNHILVCSLGKKDCVPIIKKAGKPKVLQIDYNNGFLFWTAAQQQTIRRSYLDGSHVRTISDASVWPNGLAIDHPTSRLYWVNFRKAQIDTCNYEGKDCKHLHHNDIQHAHSLAIWEDRLYWTSVHNEEHTEIHSCRKRDGKIWDYEYRGQAPIEMLSIYHESMTANKNNPCHKYGNRCSHLCLLSSNGYTCACPEEMELDHNGHECHEKTSVFVLAAFKSNLFRASLRKYGSASLQTMAFPKLNLGIVSDMDYDLLNDEIYFADPKEETIKSVSLKTEEIKTHLTNVKQLTAIAVDWLRKNIYWINWYHHSIDVVKIGGQFRKRLYYDFFRNPLSLTMDVIDGVLYVGDAGIFSSITKCSLNGSGCNTIVTSKIEPTALSLDLSTHPKRIYWTDSMKKSIESIEISGKNHQQFLTRLHEPMKIHVSDQYIFWTERNSMYLNAAPKTGEGKIHKSNLGLELKSSEDEWVIPVLVLGESNKITVRNPCAARKSCSQFCFTKTLTDLKDCGCVEGYQLSTDGTNCTPRKCEERQKRCDDGECILESFWCDGTVDCDDRSDEAYCNTRKNCTEKEFQCHNGICIHLEEKCDGFHDCHDKSDESKEICINKTRTMDTCFKTDDWQCKSGHCIPQYLKCNKHRDCIDGSDEDNCPKEIICQKEYRKCTKNEECILQHWWCDGVNDCPDGEDEIDCSCSRGQYRCKNGECLDEWKICEGIVSCDQNEKVNLTCPDKGNKNSTNCPMNSLSCGPHLGNKEVQCVPHVAWCNGSAECSNRYDEMNCLLDCSHHDLIRCRTSDSCIEPSWRCDGIEDCPDGLDEEKCIPPELKSGHSRETMQTNRMLCSSNQFECPDGKCIPIENVCDARNDCLNEADEIDCDKCQIDNGGCQHICHNNPIKVRCSCKEGFELSYDEKTCHDKNECVNEELCHHKCVNLKGSYYCACEDGYVLLSDHVSCKPINGHQYSVAAVHGITFHLLKSNLDDALQPSAIPADLDTTDSHFLYDPAQSSLMFIEGMKGNLHRRNRDGKWIITSLGVTGITASSFDYINDNLYLARPNYLYFSGNATMKKLAYTELKVYNIKTKRIGVASQIGRFISALEVSVPLREMVTCECVQSCQKSKAILVIRKLDGSSDREIEDRKIISCNYIAFDEIKKRIYWLDTALNKIESVDYLGYDRKSFKTQELHGGRGLALLDHSLLWFNLQYRTLVRCSIKEPNKCEKRTFDESLSIVSIEPVYNMTTSTPCTNYTTCEYICTPSTSEIPHCICREGFISKNRKCIKNSSYVELPLIDGICDNGECKHGVCEQKSTTQMFCSCFNDYRGPYCDKFILHSNSYEGQNPLVGVIIFLVLTALVFAGFVICYKKKPEVLWKKVDSYTRFSFNSSFTRMKDSDDNEEPDSPILKQRRSSNEVLEKQMSQHSDDSAIVIESPGVDKTEYDSCKVELLTPERPEHSKAKFKPKLEFSSFNL